MHCQFLTKDQSLAQGLGIMGCQDSGFCIPSLGPCSGSVSIQTACPPKNQAVLGGWAPLSSTWTAAGCDPEHLDAETNQHGTFPWKCSCLICFSASCLSCEPVMACDASITHTASGTMDKAESLPSIQTCQSRSKYEAVLKPR